MTITYITPSGKRETVECADDVQSALIAVIELIGECNEIVCAICDKEEMK